MKNYEPTNCVNEAVEKAIQEWCAANQNNQAVHSPTHGRRPGQGHDSDTPAVLAEVEYCDCSGNQVCDICQGRVRYKTLSPEFLQAMDEIGLYGMQKYGDKSFEVQRKARTLWRMKRTQTEEIGKHIENHYGEYASDIPHDHFGTLRHQLAAAAFNAMMEYVYATVADGKIL